MKRALFLVISLLACIAASAYTCVSFKSGDPSILMQKVTITYEIDWDHARVTNHDNMLFPQYLQKRGADFVADWPKDREKAEKYFTVRFNKKSDYLKIDEDGRSGEYKMTVRIATIDVGNGGSNFNPYASSKAGGTIINGTIEFANRQGQVVCVLNIIEGKGTGYPSETIRYGLALSEIAADIHDFIDDDVKKGKVKATAVAPTVAAATAATTATTVATATTVTTPAATVSSKEKTTVPAAASSATGGEARVTLKNGSVIIGKVKAFDPTTSITLFVAGLTTTIPMNEVQNVESVGGGSLTAAPATTVSSGAAVAGAAVAPAGESLGSRKLLVTDGEKYPQHITLNVNGHQLRLVLVRGGRLNMGYDGSGSRKMMSEPIHEVAVTSFYISDQPIPATVANQIVRDVEGKGNEPAQFREYNDAQKMVNIIAQQTGKPYRLPTEAEWEYAASGDQQNAIFTMNSSMYTYYEWTSDYHDDFPDDQSVLTDPTGPSYGDEHQVRSFNGKRGKYDRSNKVDEDDAYTGVVRLVIKAKDR